MSPFLMNMASCFIVILINQGLKEHGGDLAIGAFGIVNRIVFVFIMTLLADTFRFDFQIFIRTELFYQQGILFVTDFRIGI